MKNSGEERDEPNRWFVVRVLYGREIKLKTYLDTINIDSFIPMRLTEVTKDGKTKRELLPAIRNLIFIYIRRSNLDIVKKEMESSVPFRCFMDKAKKIPLIVPDKQMKHFIALSNSLSEQSYYLTHVGPTLKIGAKVRVTSGIFQGIEGTIVRIKRDRRIMVNIEGVVAIVSAYIHSSFLQEIGDE